MHNNEPKELDRIIDRALASYIEAQPSANLQHRVLENIRRATHRRLRIWQWALATPLLAASLFLLVARYTEHRDPTPPPVATRPMVQPVVTTAPKAAPAQTASFAPLRNVKRARHSSSAARENAPNYLTVSDSALIALGREKPEQLQALFAREEEPKALTPIRIDEIDIEPIATEPLQ